MTFRELKLFKFQQVTSSKVCIFFFKRLNEVCAKALKEMPLPCLPTRNGRELGLCPQTLLGVLLCFPFFTKKLYL